MIKPTGLISYVIALATALAASQMVYSNTSYAKERIQPPANARPMTAGELSALFGNKSWQWPDGAGRMEKDNRRFSAIVGSGKQGSWAEGQWTVTDRGRFCFSANWYTGSSYRPSKTCFLHVIDGGTIYQRKERGGNWYIFKHAKTEAGDEINKLVRADLVSAELRKRQMNARPKKKQK